MRARPKQEVGGGGEFLFFFCLFLSRCLTVDVLVYESRLLVFPRFESLVCLAHVWIPSPLHSFVPFLIGIVCLQPINENMPIEFIEKRIYCMVSMR